MLTKTQIVALSKKHSFFLKRSLGQNYLVDRNARDKIIRLLELGRGDVVLEIGSGLGALTEGLAACCARVYAVEKDKKIAGLSREILKEAGSIDIITADILEFDVGSVGSGLKVVGAVPYYITSPILQHLFIHKKHIDSIFVIVQKELAARMAAGPSTKTYSSFSLFTQFHADIDILMDLGRTLFFPVPEVDSCLVRLKILPDGRAAVMDRDMLFKVIRAAFGQRRKTVLSALSQKKALGLDKEQVALILNELSIDTRSRAETLSLEQFAEIANAVIDFLT